MDTADRFDATARFSNVADGYDRYRPSYPAAALDEITRGLQPGAHVVDIGAGTGISSRLFAERGYAVTAVEPNAAMRAAAPPHPRVTYVDGRGEATGLPNSCCALVVYAQAFHWVEPRAAVAEAIRILEPGGRLVAMWNSDDFDDAFSSEYRRLMLEFATDREAALARVIAGRAIIGDERLEARRRITFPNEQALDLDGLIGRAFSSSYAPRDAARRQALTAALTELFARHEVEGQASLGLIVEIYEGRTRYE